MRVTVYSVSPFIRRGVRAGRVEGNRCVSPFIPGHADRLLKEDAGLEQVAVKIAAGLRNEPIRVAQQGERAVEALRRWYAGHGLYPRCVFLALTLSRLVLRRAEAVPEQQGRTAENRHVREIEGRPVV